MFKWIVIGGGIHGTYLSHLLTSELGFDRRLVKVIDPFAQACGRWKQLTARTGMQFLRSPYVHNLATVPGNLSGDLTKFQSDNRYEDWAVTAGTTRRPSLEMFNLHIESLCQRHRLEEMRVQATAMGVFRAKGGLRVRTTVGDYLTERVLLAISSNDELLIPAWAKAYPEVIKHVFAPDYEPNSLTEGESIAVVGCGISAAQVALRAAETSPGKVTLLVRRPLKVAEFDSDECWMGPECLSKFAREKNYRRRRSMIKSARNKGTITYEVNSALRYAVRRGALQIKFGEVSRAVPEGNRSVGLYDASNQILCSVNKVVLATGFKPGNPGSELVDQIVGEFSAPIAPDGFPIVDESLRWNHQIFVTGALAELEVGPPARNILGAHLSGQRLTKHFWIRRRLAQLRVI